MLRDFSSRAKYDLKPIWDMGQTWGMVVIEGNDCLSIALSMLEIHCLKEMYPSVDPSYQL